MTQENKKEKGRKKGKAALAVKIVLLCICAGVFVFAAISLCSILLNYKTADDDLQKAKTLYPTESTTEPAAEDTGILPEFQSLLEANPDTIGYLKMPGILDMPIVQCTNNKYYIDHTFYEKVALGTPFADYRAQITRDYVSQNVTIYGHMAKNGTYFAPLKQYTDMSFYKNHKTFTFDSIYKRSEYLIFGVFITKVNIGTNANDPEEYNYHDYVDLTEDQFNQYLKEIDERSFYDTNIDVKYGDELVTLSTCDHTIREETDKRSRLVIVGRRLREGESLPEIQVSANKDMQMPSEWQEKYGKANPYS